MTVVRELLAELGIDTSAFEAGVDRAEKKATVFDKTLAGLSSVGGAVVTGALGLAATGATLLGVELYRGVEAATASQDVQTQLAAVLESTGGIAGVTAEQAKALALELSGVTKFSDEAIISGENMLLTFTNIGKDVFPEATQIMLDMSQALGQDLKASSIQLGKALNDPIQGVSALREVGVNFTDEQQLLITGLVESGQTMEAQRLILKELGLEFGGSAKAAGSTFGGQMEILKNIFTNMEETVGGALLPTLTQLATTLSEYLTRPETIAFIQGLASGLASFAQSAVTQIPIIVEHLERGFGWLAQNQSVIVGALAAIGVALAAFVYTTVVPALVAAVVAAGPVILVMAAIGAAVYLLHKAWSENWGGIREKAAPVFEFVMTSLQNWWNFFTVTLPNAIATLRERWTSGFQGIRDAISGVIDFVIRLRDNLIDIVLPDWLTPGSPTPFETGLWGIASAMEEVNALGLPALNQGPSGLNSGAPIAPETLTDRQSAAQGGKSVVTNINIYNPTGEPTEESVRKSLKRLSYLGVPT